MPEVDVPQVDVPPVTAGQALAVMVTMYFLDQALKMLTTVEAKLRPPEYNRTKYLWRGMRNITLDADLFFQEGGTELVS